MKLNLLLGLAWFALIPASDGFTQAIPNSIHYDYVEAQLEETYLVIGMDEFIKQSPELFSGRSILAIRDVLAQEKHPLTRIAAFYAAQKIDRDNESKLLPLLLLNSDSFVLYEREFEKVQALDQAKIHKAVISILDKPLGKRQSANLNLMLRSLPAETIQGLVQQVVDGVEITAIGLACLLEEAHRRDRRWIDSESKRQAFVKLLKSLELIPGHAQATYVYLYPFQNDIDALRHIKMLLEDTSLDDAQVILAIARFKDLCVKGKAQIVLDSKNKAIVEWRLSELERRIR
jgi:RNase P/RNase MRP subunit POP5